MCVAPATWSSRAPVATVSRSATTGPGRSRTTVRRPDVTQLVTGSGQAEPMRGGAGRIAQCYVRHAPA